MSAKAAAPVERRMFEKRRRIVRAALELFAERGYHGTAVPLVAERAKVGAGTIYRFFDSKEALVNAAFEDAKSRLGAALLTGLDLSAGPRPLFEAFWQRLVAFARSDPAAFHFLELQDHAPYLDPERRGLERQVLSPIHAVCTAFQQSGVVRSDMDSGAIIAFCWGAFVGLMKAERLGYLELNDDTFREAREACWRAFAKR